MVCCCFECTRLSASWTPRLAEVNEVRACVLPDARGCSDRSTRRCSTRARHPAPLPDSVVAVSVTLAGQALPAECQLPEQAPSTCAPGTVHRRSEAAPHAPQHAAHALHACAQAMLPALVPFIERACVRARAGRAECRRHRAETDAAPLHSCRFKCLWCLTRAPDS